MNRIPFDQVQQTLKSVLEKLGMSASARRYARGCFARPRARRVYARDNRFPRFVETIRNGKVDVKAEPKRVSGTARWSAGWTKRRRNLNALAPWSAPSHWAASTA